jgi:hypothetical protein
MSRETQFIGLTDRATRLVASAVKTETYDGMTTGMFGESMPGRIFTMPDSALVPYKYKEVVQDSPWSSGPMIFTHLIPYYKDGGGHSFRGRACCSWVLDPSLQEENVECDSVTGTYYV